MIPRSVLDLIGRTPMVELTHLDAGPCRLFAKLENQNPGGSIKDRMALSMIRAAERDGHLRPGGLLVEATAGNTGIGLALVASQSDYRLLLVIPDKMSQEKVLHLRIFPDAFDKMNLSVLDIAGEILVISQFTLLGDCRKGRRPSYISAAPPEHAEPLYQAFVDAVRQSGRRVETGRFQETMQVHLINDGPVTLLLDSRKVF